MRYLHLLIAALALPWLAPLGARGAGYESLLEQGSFYLERGPTYGAEAVRALEKAREADPQRAGKDPKLLTALARGYGLTARNSEALWTLEALEGLGPLGPDAEGLRARLLSESGLGRLRVVSAFALRHVTARLEPAADARLDAAARKALDRLGELLARGLDPGPGGVTLLVPEGRFTVSFEGAGLFSPRDPVPVEVWAGDETALRLVPVHPDRSQWSVSPGSRSVELRWPPVEGVAYELLRELGSSREPVYNGSQPSFVDGGLPVGAVVKYVLKVIGPQGDVLSASSVEAETLPPVSSVSAEARLETDLRASVSWKLGGGTADRVRVVRKGPGGEGVVLDTRERDRISAGAVADGPFVPGVDGVALEYRVEAWLGTGEAPAAQGLAAVEVPPAVERVSEVAQSVDRGAVIVQWETFPREGIAQGYAVFRQRTDDAEGELVARVADPFAREFDYPVEDPVKASEWRHFVVPYVGDRYLLDPEALTVRGQGAEESLERRVQRGAAVPNLAVSWAPYPGALGYVARSADGREFALKKNYLEVHGLQNPLMGASQQMVISAVNGEGNLVELVTVEIRFQHYARTPAPTEEGQ